MNLFPNSKSGFTLIEIIVSLGIFAIVAVVALGALVKIISANKKAQTLQSSITNLNFALDAMSRELRVGSSYHCETHTAFIPVSGGATLSPQTCVSDSDTIGGAIAFVSAKGYTTGASPCRLIFEYRFKASTVAGSTVWSIEKAQQSACDSPIGSDDFTPIVADNVTVTGYHMEVQKAAGDKYPLAFIRLSGYAGVREKERTYFDVQTAVSARTP